MYRKFALAFALLFSLLAVSQAQKPPTGQSQKPATKDDDPFSAGDSQPAQSPVPEQAAPTPPKRTGPPPTNAECLDCHVKSRPQIIAEWKQSKHGQVNVGCIECHGSDHGSPDDVANVKILLANACAKCHQTQADQDRLGKHSRGLGAMKTMPNAHWRAAGRGLSVGGGETCSTCHRTGSPHIFRDLPFDRVGGIEGRALEFGAGACTSCHSRHSFSVQEARQPQACQFCHNAPDADQWGMFASSRHGVLFDLKQRGLLPADAAIPTCQTCHMPSGNHNVLTAWGFRGIAFPLPDDKQWAADVTDQMKALNILESDGSDGMVKSTMKGTDLMRFTKEDWQRERDRMIKICSQCHAEGFAKREMKNGDDLIRNADHLLAEAIRVVADLYKDKILTPPSYERYFPWLTRFDAPPTVIEQKLDKMYQIDRMRAFQGAFHGSPKYAFAEGLEQMQRDLDNIKELAAKLRKDGPASRTPIKAQPSAKLKSGQADRP